MESIWQATSNMPKFMQLDGNKRCDVLIIGGGMAGILTAYFLQQEGLSCILVEKEELAGGTTGHTTAKLTLQHGLIYQKLYRQYGTERTEMYYAANAEALRTYERLIRHKGISCEYRTEKNYVYMTKKREGDNSKRIRERNKLAEKMLEKECSILKRLGANADFVKNDKLSIPIETLGAVGCMGQAQFHPLHFLERMVEGLQIYERTFVKKICGKKAYTDQGIIEADRIMVTTHFPMLDRHGSYFLKMYQSRSYVLALKGAENIKGMYVDADSTGLSFRNYEDYLLLGGGAHRTGKAGGGFEELRMFATRNFSRTEESFAWAAQDCMSLDQVPYIGNYSAITPNLYTATGFNKWGMTGAMVAAMLLTDKVLERQRDWEICFSPSRNMLKKQLVVNVSETLCNFLTPKPKRCSHLGCALKWNAAEKSWDCACHGSRFSQSGKVLDNPAKKDIK